ncbi:MAG: hypothetical protein KDE08_05505 [Rhodobacteraceae bacterium]|nr:hypothetical protein [Paracoccaceae bacterium]
MAVNNVLDAFERLLGDERQALREGALARLGELVRRKSDLLATISVASVDLRRLQSLQGSAERNRVVLAAALKGIRAAETRMSMIRSADKALSVYDSRGRSQNLGPATSELERRA